MSVGGCILIRMAELDRVKVWANALIVLHLDPTVWTFGFDNAKKRAGLCNFTAKRITVSRYLAARYDDDEIHQILLHEVAHAIAGARAGHGPRWLTIARDLGYEGSSHPRRRDRARTRSVGRASARPVMRTSGYRKPAQPAVVRTVLSGLQPANVISWSRRDITRRRSTRGCAAAE